MKIENIISGKLVIAIALINVILIALSYMGITEAAGFLYSTAGPYKYITGTESEYIKLNTNLVFSIVYILFYIVSYLLILLYFVGKVFKPISFLIDILFIYQIFNNKQLILIFYEKYKTARYSQRNHFARREKNHLHGNCQASYGNKTKNSSNY